MLAYLLERELYKYWRRLEVTVEEGIDELGSLRGIEITIGSGTCQNVPEPTGLSKQLLVPCLRNLFLDIGNLRYLEVSTE